MRNKKGQSILEYIIVLTVIIAAITWAATTYIGPGIQKSFQNMNSSIVNASERINYSVAH
jgi:hypothetical protein